MRCLEDTRASSFVSNAPNPQIGKEGTALYPCASLSNTEPHAPYLEQNESLSLKWKAGMAFLNNAGAAAMIYLYERHNVKCEPYSMWKPAGLHDFSSVFTPDRSQRVESGAQIHSRTAGFLVCWPNH